MPSPSDWLNKIVLGLATQDQFIARQVNDPTLDGHLILPSQAEFNAAWIGQPFIDVLPQLNGNHEINLSNVNVQESLFGDDLFFYGLMINQCEFRHVLMSSATIGTALVIVDTNLNDTLTSVNSLFNANHSSEGLGVVIQSVECRDVNLEKIYSKSILLNNVAIKSNLELRSNSVNNIDIMGDTSMRGFELRGASGTSVSVDYERVSIAKHPQILIAPLEYIGGLKRLQENAP